MHAGRSGADALGLNFATHSVRRVSVPQAAEIARAVRESTASPPELIGVFVDAPWEHIIEVSHAVGLDAVQLHGEESEDLLGKLAGRGVRAFKAMRIQSPLDAAAAGRFPGERLLVDAKVEGAQGGTGTTFDWTLILEQARSRQLILAGGLHPGNVAAAVALVRPYGVDTASGVELRPGIKDPERVRAFVEAARSACG